tara:strand:- start:52 stop:858 length:807 start_codon:yes stop_codon:yes gene_type:complete
MKALFLIFMTYFWIFLANGENCVIMWSGENQNSKMEFKMCVEQLPIIENNLTLLNLSNFRNSTKSEELQVNGTINETVFTAPAPAPRIMHEANVTNASVVITPTSDVENIVSNNITNSTSISPSSYSEIVSSPSPTSDGEQNTNINTKTSPSSKSSHYIASIDKIIENNSTTSDVNETRFNKKIPREIDNFDYGTLFGILGVSIFGVSILLAIILKKRKRKNVQPLCKFIKKKKRSLERPKDLLIEYMTENPLKEEKNNPNNKNLDNV